jgi:hypothetical protein
MSHGIGIISLLTTATPIASGQLAPKPCTILAPSIEPPDLATALQRPESMLSTGSVHGEREEKFDLTGKEESAR